MFVANGTDGTCKIYSGENYALIDILPLGINPSRVGYDPEVEDAAVAAAKEAESQTLNQYKAGTVPYSSVITAQTTRLSSKETALAVLFTRIQARVALIEALGGGWCDSRL